MFEQQVKCVVWDLDETLWDGTLAEGEEIAVRPELVRLIQLLDSVGVVNSVCSKNDYEDARRELEAVGLWDYLVFPVISFSPKGPSVKAMLEAMQLRSVNALFLDDHPGNRNEVLHYCPGISVADVNDPACLAALHEVASHTRGRSRLAQYRTLERKHEARKAYGDNKAFLDSSEITVCILRNPGNLVFKERIVELANRSNQLNFTHSRFSHGEFEEYVAGQQSVHVHHGSVFVYDRFGDYGMVGFYAFDERAAKPALDHFVFSCRVMNMGVEQAVYRHLRTAYGVRRFRPLEGGDGRKDVSLTLIHALDEHLEAYVAGNMELPGEYAVSIVAGCTSGILGHYVQEFVEPARFDNFTLAQDTRIENVAAIVFAIYGEYPDDHWRRVGGFSLERFAYYLTRFLDRHRDRPVVLLLASERYGGRKRGSRTRGVRATLLRPVAALYRAAGFGRVRFGRVRRCNAVVRRVAARHPNVTLIESGSFVREPSEQVDPLHFERVVIRRMAAEIGPLLARADVALLESEAAR